MVIVGVAVQLLVLDVLCVCRHVSGVMYVVARVFRQATDDGASSAAGAGLVMAVWQSRAVARECQSNWLLDFYMLNDHVLPHAEFAAVIDDPRAPRVSCVGVPHPIISLTACC